MKKYFIHHIILFYQFIYLAVGILCLILTPYTITTPDTFNYLLISEQLIQGQFYEAVSGHWSIGISILIAPLMALGLDGILAFKIINTVIGLLALTLFLQIIARIDDFPESSCGKVVGTGIAFIIILPFLLSMTLELTPDLLLTTLLLWYLKILIQSCLAFSNCKTTPQQSRRTFSKCQTTRNYGWKCGLIAGLAYWAKAYTLPFFIIHFIGINVLATLVAKYKNRKSGGFKPTAFTIFAKQTIIGLFVFALISSPYIFALSTKFDSFSIGTSGTYNFSLISPHRNHDQLTKNELINPQTKFTDFWAYEEPAQFVKKWNPFATHSDRTHYSKFLWSNVIRFCYFDYARHLIIFLTISILLFFYFKIKLRREEWVFIGLMVFTAAVFTSGYFLVLVRERYFWLDNFIGLIVLFFINKKFINIFIINKNELLIRSKISANVFLKIIPFIFGALLMYDSIEMIYLQTSKQSFYKNLHKNIPELQVLKGKRVATNDTWGAYHHTDASVYLMYELRYQFWGQIRTQRLRREGLKEVKENDIDYFILWESPDLEQSIFKNEQVIFQDTFPRMAVYQIDGT